MVLQERYRASERLVCRVVGQNRSTQRHPAKVVSIEEGKLRHRLREIAAEHIRWGRRMAYMAVAALATVDAIPVASKLPTPALQRRQPNTQ